MRSAVTIVLLNSNWLTNVNANNYKCLKILGKKLLTYSYLHMNAQMYIFLFGFYDEIIKNN